MSDRVTIGIDVDTSTVNLSIEEIKEKADEATRQWAIDRNTILRQVRETFTLISQMMSTFRMAMSLTGKQIDPFFSALIGMTLSTVSMMISAASVMAMTGVGAVAAAVLFGVTISFQTLTLGKLIADKLDTEGAFANINTQLKQMKPRTPQGISF